MSGKWTHPFIPYGMHQTFNDGINALVGIRDFLTRMENEYLKSLLTEENTIQGWIDVCCEICEVMDNE